MYARIDVITTDRWQIYWINQRLSGVVIDTQSNLRPHTLNTHTLWAESNHSVMYISSSVSPFNINASPQWDCTPAPIAANCPITINHPPPTLHLHTPPPVPSFSHLPVWPWLSLSASCVFWTEDRCVECAPTPLCYCEGFLCLCSDLDGTAVKYVLLHFGLIKCFNLI